MITCGSMSTTARLGNQLFHIGVLYSVFKKHGYEIHQPNTGEQFWKCFDFDTEVITNTKPNKYKIQHSYNERCDIHETNEVYSQKDYTSYHGWFQSHIFYKECRQDYIDFLKFKPEHSDYANNEIEKIKNKYNLPITAVHYRRTDYLDKRAEHIHGNLSKYGYYDAAYNAIKSPTVYLVFSDDIEWCKQNVKLKHVEYIDADEYKSLCMMSKCDTNIIANSTFSWWGAFLNPKAKIYAPNRWNGPLAYAATGNISCIDIDYRIPTDWNRIETKFKF